ncbi:tyrosine-type recombinase/integrase [Streptomyces sp. 4503]|uniref:Tyrosine-type recombinase/integrase n=1 Tax=Streptomyces niphimycinicus TaxID=2842201 RepID=A0ABS6CXN6_9ACTN|nr:tyrosine-type recombinase/integrase [Streptomyces niphimycinicus]
MRRAKVGRTGYVFTRPNGTPIKGTLTRHFTALLHRARLRRIRFHLRHSAATLLLEQGVELVVIKELLGHAHIGVYAHARLRLQRQAIDTLGNALGRPTMPPRTLWVPETVSPEVTCGFGSTRAQEVGGRCRDDAGSWRYV